MNGMGNNNRQFKMDTAGLAHILPETARTYEQYTGQCFENGALDARTKQLIALGVALSESNEICAQYHVRAARQMGASDVQIMETVAVASAAASGNMLTHGVQWVQGALGREVTGSTVGSVSSFGQQFHATTSSPTLPPIPDLNYARVADAPGMIIPGGNAISPSY